MNSGKSTDIEKAGLILLNTESKKLESDFIIQILPTFKADLQHQLLTIRAYYTSGGNNGFVNKIIFESKTQANQILPFRYINKYCRFIHSANTDFIAILGPQCVLTKNVSYIKDKK